MKTTGVDGVVASAPYRTGTDRSSGSAGAAGSAPIAVSASPIVASPTPERSRSAIKSDSLDFISAVATSPLPVDAKMVQAIRNLIGSGAYPIDAHTIATKMIDLDVRAPATGNG